jgi:peptidoglycan hydrolase CwlO-like protein
LRSIGVVSGLQGVGVAAAALTGVVNMLFTGYTSDDLERDVERKAAKIEARADRLEAKADKLEMLADEVQDLYDQIEDSIPELRGDI